ncbi:unnamed protein product, partial [Phaeothamnion confervicola]
LDASFGTGGVVAAPDMQRLATGAAGRIYAVAGFDDVTVTALTATGTIDGSFGVGGSLSVDLTSDHSVADLAVAPDGSLYIAGANRIDPATFQPMLLHVSTGGVLDSSFVPALPADADMVMSMDIDGSRLIVLTAEAFNGGGRLFPLHLDGSIDQSYAG